MATFQKARWNASGKIPLRAVTDGTLDRFSAVDPSEGGNTLRSNGKSNYHYDTKTTVSSLPMPMRNTTSLICSAILPSFSMIQSAATAFSNLIGGSSTAAIWDTNSEAGCSEYQASAQSASGPCGQHSCKAGHANGARADRHDDRQ